MGTTPPPADRSKGPPATRLERVLAQLVRLARTRTVEVLAGAFAGFLLGQCSPPMSEAVEVLRDTGTPSTIQGPLEGPTDP